MVEALNEFVTPDRFVERMNEVLSLSVSFQAGMRFLNLGTGYDFVSRGLTVMADQALDKIIFDEVSAHATVVF